LDVVVLIEGLEDRSALLERASARDIDLSSQGVAVLPCNGKTKIGRPAVIFEQLGRSVYIMFDSDHDDESEAVINKRLLRLVNFEQEN
jgi:putative ATP-dependent endonuclease of OLD family